MIYSVSWQGAKGKNAILCHFTIEFVINLRGQSNHVLPFASCLLPFIY